MTQGTVDDVRDVVNGRELVRLWDQMYLPKKILSARQLLIDAGRVAALGTCCSIRCRNRSHEQRWDFLMHGHLRSPVTAP
ncbi:MAG: hypothetical protein ACRDTC_28385 [Pseudonocardiaceae bacterium]